MHKNAKMQKKQKICKKSKKFAKKAREPGATKTEKKTENSGEFGERRKIEGKTQKKAAV